MADLAPAPVVDRRRRRRSGGDSPPVRDAVRCASDHRLQRYLSIIKPPAPMGVKLQTACWGANFRQQTSRHQSSRYGLAAPNTALCSLP